MSSAFLESFTPEMMPRLLHALMLALQALKTCQMRFDGKTPETVTQTFDRELVNNAHIALCSVLPWPAVQKAPPSVLQETSPAWQAARLLGRQEVLYKLQHVDPDVFCDAHIGSHAIGDTGDYANHWDMEKLSKFFDIGVHDSVLEKLSGLYWENCVALTYAQMERRNSEDPSDE